MPRAPETKLVHSIETGNTTSNHERVLRKRIEETILKNVANQDEDIDEVELRRRVFLEEASKKTYTVSKTEVDTIITYVWDKGLTGTRDERMMEELYAECELPPSAVARRDKIKLTAIGEDLKTKVRNVYRTYRETKEMFSDGDQAVEELAGRLFKLICSFKERDDASEALAAYGITIDDE